MNDLTHKIDEFKPEWVIAHEMGINDARRDVWGDAVPAGEIPGGAVGREFYRNAYHEGLKWHRRLRNKLMGIEVQRHA